MSHSISAFVARAPIVAALSRALGGAPFYKLRSEQFFVLPITDDAFDAHVAASGPSELAAEDFWRLTVGLCDLAKECSQFGAVAYVETDYFGGTGTQGAAAWSAAKEILAPAVSLATGPINTALNAIGLAPEDGMDEFETLGLDGVRRMDAFEEMTPAR
ncbi:MAG: hypothetical protein ABL996_25700 [Micropepsaceae bacterium]